LAFGEEMQDLQGIQPPRFWQLINSKIANTFSSRDEKSLSNKVLEVEMTTINLNALDLQ